MIMISALMHGFNKELEELSLKRNLEYSFWKFLQSHWFWWRGDGLAWGL